MKCGVFLTLKQVRLSLMSRPLKEGLDYFPHDTMAHADPKIASLMAMYGTDGYAFYFIMLELIFRAENGRITIGKQLEKTGLAHAMCMKLKRFEQILLSAIEIGCFDEVEFKERNILTSNGVSKRIQKINNDRGYDRKRKEILKEKEKEKEKAKSGKLPENYRKTTEAENIIAFLNQVCGTNYKKTTKKIHDLINARFNEGFTIDNFKLVIITKHAEWINTEMMKYLRPETLFGNKFESYLNQPIIKPQVVL